METKKENKVKAVLGAVGIMLVYLLIQLVVSIISSIVISVSVPHDNMDRDALVALVSSYQSLVLFISNLICTVLFGIWYYLGYVKKDKLSGTYISWLKKICDINAIGFIVSSVFAIAFFDRHVADLVMILSPESGDYFKKMMSYISDPTLTNMLSTVILSSAATAFSFSGIMMQNLKKAFGMAGCIIIPAILFALLMLNPVQTIYGIPFGLVMMFISYKFDSAIAGLIVITINNSISFIIGAVFQQQIPTAVSACLVVVFLGLSIFFYRKLPFSHKDESDVPSQSE